MEVVVELAVIKIIKVLAEMVDIFLKTIRIKEITTELLLLRVDEKGELADLVVVLSQVQLHYTV
jgi:hypothetical protein